MKLFHTTWAANCDAIERSGFRDATGTYGTDSTHTGVWFSNRPLGSNEGHSADQWDVYLIKNVFVLVLDVPDHVAAPYEWAEEGKPYREFLIPASVVNEYPIVAKVGLWENRLYDEFGDPSEVRVLARLLGRALDELTGRDIQTANEEAARIARDLIDRTSDDQLPAIAEDLRKRMT